MTSKTSAHIELAILWFRVQTEVSRVGLSFSLALVSLLFLYASLPLLSLLFCGLFAAGLVDTWWEQHFANTITDRVKEELRVQASRLEERVQEEAGKIVAEHLLFRRPPNDDSNDEEEDEDDSDDYEYAFPMKNGGYPNPSSGCGAVAVGEHGWKNKNWNGKGREDERPKEGAGEPGSGEDGGGNRG